MIDLEQMSASAVLAHWKGVIEDTSPRPWTTKEDLGHYFQHFRPSGKGVDRVVLGLTHGNEFLRRLGAIYSATEHAGRATDMYFVVRDPAPSASGDIQMLAQEHLGRMTAFAKELGARELCERLASMRIVVEAALGDKLAVPSEDTDTATMLSETLADWFACVEQPGTHALLLTEALYLMACDYDLQRFVLWPAYCKHSKVDFPFDPYFQLWAEGATLTYGDDGVMVVAVPNLR